MVFSSVPLYLDPPNWQEHPNETQNHHLAPPPPPAAQPVGTAVMGGPTQPNSMAERARLAKIPMPEVPLKCPRCDSTNTKFCYFNNYSLSQPRHFCKTCRRYWTRGGTLRNVPVGGGCRRNKRRKSSGGARPKSPSKAASSAAEPRQQPAGAEFGASSGGHQLLQPVGPGNPLSFMATLQNLTHTQMGNLGLGFGPQQLPLLGGFGAGFPASLMHPFQNVGMETASFGKALGLSQLPGVAKTEESSRGGGHLNLSEQLVGMTENVGQFWGGNTAGITSGLWTDLSGITSSSTASHIL